MPESTEISKSNGNSGQQLFVCEVVRRRCLWVHGLDAGSYLHSQLSNDIIGLAPGDSCQSFVLEPTGKVDALVRVTRLPATNDVDSHPVDTYLIDTDADDGDFNHLLQRLQRFKIRVKADFSTGMITTIALRSAAGDGPSSPDSATSPLTREILQAALDEIDPSDANRFEPEYLVVNSWWATGRAFDVLVVPSVMGSSQTNTADTEVHDSSASTDGGKVLSHVIGKLFSLHSEFRLAQGRELEDLRIRSGWPAMGAEIRAGETIPAATGIVRHAASFTKGCYPGQELVERMDSRGSSAPQSLRIVSLDELGPLQPGDVINVDEKHVGTVTSVSDRLALAYISRSVELGAVVGDT